MSRTTSSTKEAELLKTATTHDTETTGITRDTRTLLNICLGQDIEDKNKIAPRQLRPKWESNDKLRTRRVIKSQRNDIICKKGANYTRNDQRKTRHHVYTGNQALQFDS